VLHGSESRTTIICRSEPAPQDTVPQEADGEYRDAGNVVGEQPRRIVPRGGACLHKIGSGESGEGGGRYEAEPLGRGRCSSRSDGEGQGEPQPEESFANVENGRHGIPFEGFSQQG